MQQKILDAVMACSIDNRSSIMANVMVTGGNTMFEGLPQVNWAHRATLSSLGWGKTPHHTVATWSHGVPRRAERRAGGRRCFSRSSRRSARPAPRPSRSAAAPPPLLIPRLPLRSSLRPRPARVARVRGVQVLASPERHISAWVGGSVLAGLGNWSARER